MSDTTSPRIIIAYAPPGEERKQWEVETDSWTYGETVEIESEYGGDADDFFIACRTGSHTARRILLWMIRRRTERDLRLEDLDDMRVSYIGFFQTKPAADPKDEAPEEPAVQGPAEESAAE
jgi:hypothetical protein